MEDVYEVFAQARRGEPFSHVGSLLAGSDELARLLAKEQFGRRGEAVGLWVVPRRAILPLPEGMIGPATPRAYRLGEGYRATVAKRAALRERFRHGA